MTDKEILQKVENGERLTVPEIKRYQQLVKPQKQVYGKYGNLKKQYLEDKGLDWTIADFAYISSQCGQAGRRAVRGYVQ